VGCENEKHFRGLRFKLFSKNRIYVIESSLESASLRINWWIKAFGLSLAPFSQQAYAQPKPTEGTPAQAAVTIYA